RSKRDWSSDVCSSDLDDNLLVVRVALVRALELHDPVRAGISVVGGDADKIRGGLDDDTCDVGLKDLAGVSGRALLHAGAHEGRIDRKSVGEGEQGEAG